SHSKASSRIDGLQKSSFSKIETNYYTLSFCLYVITVSLLIKNNTIVQSFEFTVFRFGRLLYSIPLIVLSNLYHCNIPSSPTKRSIFHLYTPVVFIYLPCNHL